MTEPMEWSRIAVAAAALLGGIVLGLALRVLLGWLTRRAGRTRWEWDDLVLRLLRDLTVVSGTALGAWSAVLTLRLRPGLQRVSDQILMAACILVVTVATARFAAGAVSTATRSRSGVAQSTTIFVNIVRVVVVGTGLLVLLQSLGVSITPLLTALGVGGLAVALALQDTLANLFAGVHILVSRKVQQGDYVRLDGGQHGYIVDINWRNTTIRELSGNLVIVPNSRFADAILTNYHKPSRDMSVTVKVGVGYGCDLDHVERITLDVAREVLADVARDVDGHDPSVRFNTFGESRVEFSVNLRTGEFADQYLIVHEFIKRLHRRYAVEEVEIPTTPVVMAREPAAV